MKSFFYRAWRSIVTFSWTKSLLDWLITVAGTMSELAFMAAALFLCVNANVHAIVLLVFSQTTSEQLVKLATSAYVALPELILCLACNTTYGHVQTWRYNRQTSAAVWSLLFGIPTLIFLLLSFVTLSNAVLSSTFELPPWLVVLRANAGYVYAISSLLYLRIGKDQEVDRLRKKDSAYQDMYQHMLVKIRFYASQLHAQKTQYGKEKQGLSEQIHLLNIRLETEQALLKNSKEQRIQLATILKETQETLDKKTDEARKREAIITQLQNENNALNAEYSKVKAILEQTKNQYSELKSSLDKTSEDALEAYSAECIKWLNNDDKTATLDEIIKITGHSKRKVEGAYNRGEFKLSPRNKDLILKSSLAQWLRENQPKETEPKLKVVKEERTA
jgi:hypothetical protein